MSDIFLSYASADREQAKQCAYLLEQHGWSVWWDRSIPAGRTFDRVIEEELAHARCVIVLWSQASAASDWVRTEAADGVRRKILVPAMIGKVEIPLEFRRVQAADLSDWKGDPDSSGFRFLCESIATCLGAEPPRTSPPQPARSRTFPKWALAALAGALVVAAMLGLITYLDPPDDPHAVASYKIGENSKGCEPFEDPLEAVGRGPITRIDLFHMGYIHGIHIWYGSSPGDAHGFTGDNQYKPTEDRWNVPDGDRITRIEGAIQGRYVSRIRFFTQGGQASPAFGAEGGDPFAVTAPAKGALRTISGSAVRVRGKDVNRAVCSMTFHFAAP